MAHGNRHGSVVHLGYASGCSLTGIFEAPASGSLHFVRFRMMTEQIIPKEETRSYIRFCEMFIKIRFTRFVKTFELESVVAHGSAGVKRRRPPSRRASNG